MSYLYENFDKHDNNPVICINTADNMIISFTYQHLIDMCIANCKKPVTEIQLRQELVNQVNMILEDMWESFELCKENLLKKINKE